VSVRVLLQGNNELRNALKQLPADLNRQARDIVHGAATATAATLRSVYPRGATGALRDGVTVTTSDSVTTTTATVRSRAKEAAWWEYGTQVRRTAAGFNRGAMPAATGHGLISIAARERRQMTAQLVELVRAAGFEVSQS
jgi:hypothetical protein